MTRRKKIDDGLCAEMYENGDRLIDIADYFDVTLEAVHYSLRRTEVHRDRISNPKNFVMSLGAIRQRIRRNQERLNDALEREDAVDIKFWGNRLVEDRKNMNKVKICLKQQEIEELERYV